MKLEIRTTYSRARDTQEPRGLVCLAETSEESELLDAIFGNRVGQDGLIGVRVAVCRLADGYGEHYVYIRAVTSDKTDSDKILRQALEGALREADTPIPMVLHCPACGAQHVDRPQPEKGWTNPPHRSHECQACNCVWRPADVATVGVEKIETAGKADTWSGLGGDGKSKPLAYCIVNAKGELYFEEVCIWNTERDALESGDFETLKDREPDAGWRVTPFYAAPQTVASASTSQNAARYEWLRVRGAVFDGDPHMQKQLVHRCINLDEAVDAAMKLDGAPFVAPEEERKQP